MYSVCFNFMQRSIRFRLSFFAGAQNDNYMGLSDATYCHPGHYSIQYVLY